MEKTRLALAAFLAVMSIPALAQDAKSDWTVTGNVGLFSDYRFRGISQTDESPALQGGFDVGHSSGFYVGNWNSNIDSDFFAGANLEMDFYGGYKGSFGDFGYDVGLLYYYYPNSGRGDADKIDNTEIYFGIGYGGFSAKYYHAIGEFFSVDDSENSYYIDLGYTHDLGNGFGLVAHVGYQKLKGDARVIEMDETDRNSSIIDYKLGVTYDLSGFIVGLSYIDTNRDLAGARPNRNISDGTGVLSISKTF
jgi:uncharacterized protein (TIGR02001 family)